MEEDFVAWKTRVLDEIAAATGGASPATAAKAETAAAAMDPLASWRTFRTVTHGSSADANVSRSERDDNGQFTHRKPLFARVAVNRAISTAASPREARHIEFDLQHSDLSFQPGDWLGVLPQNRSRDIAALCERLGYDPQQTVSFEPLASDADPKLSALLRKPRPIHRILRNLVDFSLPATREMIAVLEAGARDCGERQRLKELATDAAAFDAFVRGPGRSMLRMLGEFPSVALPLEVLCEVLPPLQDRFYSISCDPQANPDRVALSVVVVETPMPDGHVFHGLCSNWLRDRAVGAEVPIFVRESRFRLPPDAKRPVIFAAGGIGIAPFRAFLQQLERQRVAGVPVPPVYLFFGLRNRAHDYYYRGEIEAWRESQLITSLDLAASHESDRLVFVQHRFAERADELASLVLDDGAAVLVCGAAATFGRGVYDGLADALTPRLGGRDAAYEHLSRMQREELYLQDVF